MKVIISEEHEQKLKDNLTAILCNMAISQYKEGNSPVPINDSNGNKEIA